MAMYEIIRELDNKSYTAYCTIQDGIEQRTERSLPAARRWLVGAAKTFNNKRIGPRDIHFGVRKFIRVETIEARGRLKK